MSAAHDTRIVVDGDVYFVRRDFDLIRRIEQAFGPLAELDKALRRSALTAEKVAKLYGVVLQAQAARPAPGVIEAHIMNEGIPGASNPLAKIVLELFAGHKKMAAFLEADAKAKAESEDENPPIPA